ncbi:tetratricopeptide repeat protein [Saprospira grandis]|uniref:Glycosyl transferase family protein n=1 Tax=Saprospira grandis (strain Lewin) TaxID=984262 RepID=H6L783_SAPGL|nr:tetratricopeptide repeat protein [Saprospira grandis]AFC26674.1 glycosyl transferase family protein [Saprospira grandis str. Lewin]
MYLCKLPNLAKKEDGATTEQEKLRILDIPFILPRHSKPKAMTPKLLLISLLLFSGTLLAQNKAAIKAYNTALSYYQSRDYETAAPLFEQAIQESPDFYYAHRSLISCYEQMGQLDKAVLAYLAALKLAPHDFDLHFNLSQTYIQLEEWAAAKKALEQSLDISPTDRKALQSLEQIERYLAQKEAPKEEQVIKEERSSPSDKVYNAALALYRKGEYQQARGQLQAFSGQVSQADFYYLWALCEQQLGERTAAIEQYEAALALDDRHFNSNYNLGILYYNDRNYEEAQALLETAYQKQPKKKDLAKHLALSYYLGNNMEKAEPFLAKLAPKIQSAELYYYWSKTLLQLGRKKESQKALARAKKLDKSGELQVDIQNDLAEYGQLASEYRKNGNYQKAIEVLEEAIAKHGDEAALHFNLGLNYLEVGNSLKAQKEFAKTVALTPGHAKAYSALGDIHYQAEKYSEAAAYFKACIEAGMQDAYSYYQLGSSLYKLNRFQESAESFEQAIAKNPKEKQFYFALGLSYLRQKKNDLSIQNFEKALALDPYFIDAQYHICVNYIETNRFLDAIDEAEKIIEKDPKFAKAYLTLAHSHKRLGNLAEADKYRKKAIRLDPSLR